MERRKGDRRAVPNNCQLFQARSLRRRGNGCCRSRRGEGGFREAVRGEGTRRGWNGGGKREKQREGRGARGREREIEQTFRRGGWKGRAIGGDGIQRKNGKTQSRHKSCDIDFAANFPRCRPRHIRDSSCDAAITSLTGIKIQLYIKLSYIAPYLYLSR